MAREREVGPTDAELVGVDEWLDPLLAEMTTAPKVAAKADEEFGIAANKKAEQIDSRASQMLSSPGFSLSEEFLQAMHNDYQATLMDWENTILRMVEEEVSNITIDNLNALKIKLETKNEELQECFLLAENLEESAFEICQLLVIMQQLRDDWDREIKDADVEDLVDSTREGIGELDGGRVFYEREHGYRVDPESGEWVE